MVAGTMNGTAVTNGIQMSDKDRILILLQSKLEKTSSSLKDAYAEFGKLIMSEDSEKVNKVGNKCRILEGEQNAFEECIDLIQTEMN